MQMKQKYYEKFGQAKGEPMDTSNSTSNFAYVNGIRLHYHPLNTSNDRHFEVEN